MSALLLFHDPALALHFKSLGVLQALPSLCGVRPRPEHPRGSSAQHQLIVLCSCAWHSS